MRHYWQSNVIFLGIGNLMYFYVYQIIQNHLINWLHLGLNKNLKFLRGKEVYLAIYLSRVPEAKTLILLLWHIFVSFMKKKPCKNICGVLVSFHEFLKSQSFEFSVNDVIPTNTKNILPLVCFAYLCYFYGKTTLIKVLWCFWPILRTFEVTKFWMIKLRLDVSDVIQANEHT